MFPVAMTRPKKRGLWGLRVRLLRSSLRTSQVEHQDGAYPSFSGINFYFSLDGMLVHCRVTPSIKFASTHLHTWVGTGTVIVS